uniref:Uncharacterized protein n=1 Tax=viral metagenome TaxID=1070528 RepID=A0A6M3MAB9_9ZZZZ
MSDEKISSYEALVCYVLHFNVTKENDICVTALGDVDLSPKLTPEFAEEVRTLLREHWKAESEKLGDWGRND